MSRTADNGGARSGERDSLARRLWALFSVFFKIGICTFGGGIAMLPILERELAQKRGWTDNDELLDYFAIGQSTPGIIAVNVATFIGYKRARVIGGIVATCGMVAPSLLIITIIAKFISNFSSIAWVQKALTGINVSVAALLTYAVVNFAKKSVKTVLGMVLFLLSFAAIFVFKVSTVWIIVCGCAVGVVIAAARGELRATAGGAGDAREAAGADSRHADAVVTGNVVDGTRNAADGKHADATAGTGAGSADAAVGVVGTRNAAEGGEGA